MRGTTFSIYQGQIEENKKSIVETLCIFLRNSEKI